MALFGEIASETSRAAVRSTGSSAGVSSAGSSAGVSSVVSSAVALFYIVPGSSSRKNVRVRVRVSNMLSKVPLRSNHSGAFSELDAAALDACNYVRTTLGLCFQRYFFARITRAKSIVRFRVKG